MKFNASALSSKTPVRMFSSCFLILFALATLMIGVVAQTNSDPTVLERDKSVKRELAGGQAHFYTIALVAGQYLYAVVDQMGIDVVLVLLDPEGKQMVEVDSPNGTQGPEPLSLIAETAGNYRLEIHSLEKTATAGEYEIKIVELRAAGETDRDRFAARKLYGEAEQLYREGTKASLALALEKFAQAFALFQSVKDESDEADTLSYLGSLNTSLGEQQRAISYFDQALPIYRRLADRRGEARTLNNIGGAYAESGNPQKTLSYYKQALPIYRAIGDRNGEASTLNNIGASYSRLGEAQQSLDYLNQALAIVHALGDRQSEARALNNISVIYLSLGEPQKALDQLVSALAVVRVIGFRPGEATTLNNFGNAYVDLGLPQKAIDYYAQALSVYRAIGDRGGEAVALGNISSRYSRLGDLQKAVDYDLQALRLQREVGDRFGEAITLGNLGHLLGTDEKALDYFRQALLLSRAVGNRSNEAAVLLGIAKFERDHRNLSEALTKIEAALSIVESLRSTITNEELRSSYFATVQDYYEFYIDLLMRLHKIEPGVGRDGDALQVSERARARSLLDVLAEAGADIRQGVDTTLLLRERALQDQLNANAQQQAQLLRGPHTEAQATASAGQTDSLTSQFQQVETEIRQASPRYAALTQPKPLTLKEIQTKVLDSDTLLLEYSLGAEHSYLWAVSADSITSYELPGREQIEAKARQVYLLLSDKRGARDALQALRASGEAEAPDPETKPNSSPGPVQLKHQPAQPPSSSDALQILSAILLGPVSRQLGNKRLLIVADGALQYIPFGALASPWESPRAHQYQPLVVDHEIVSLPSASTLAVLRQEVKGRKSANKIVAVLADPVFDYSDSRVSLRLRKESTLHTPDSEKKRELPLGMARAATESGLGNAGLNIPRLPGTRDEAKQILALVPVSGGKEALDFFASRETAMSAELSTYRYVHFATHGFLDSLHPELSGIVLSMVDQDGHPQDGFLRAHEIFNLNLPADLVVLSACQTGLGKEVKGEGLIGLTRGFMYAGTPRVIVSLWSVNDQATAELMARFYRGMLKENLRPATALRAAQVSLMKEKEWQSPFYWAAFTLQGEWR